jgi:gentisate 1,2-dioxygenase
MDQHRTKFKTYQEVRSAGAIGNLNEAPEIHTHGIRARLIAWPGNGYQTESVHAHPSSRRREQFV